MDHKAARSTWTVAVTLLLLAALWVIRGTLIVFGVALLLAYLLYPLVGQLSRPFGLKRRNLALALTYTLVMGLLAVVGVAIGSRVAAEARQLIARPPDAYGFLADICAAHPALAPVLEALRGRVSQQVSEIVAALPGIGLRLLAASANLIYVIVIPILSFFFLKDGWRIRDTFLEMINDGASRASARQMLEDVNTVLLQYMRGLLILCCTALIVLGIGLSVIGVHYALLLATIAFFCEFVPTVGPLAEIVVILAVSAMTGYSHTWGLAAGLGIFRVVQDYVIWPRLMSRGVELHPLWIIFGVFAGGNIGGVAGVFLAVPVLASARLLLFPAR